MQQPMMPAAGLGHQQPVAPGAYAGNGFFATHGAAAPGGYAAAAPPAAPAPAAAKPGDLDDLFGFAPAAAPAAPAAAHAPAAAAPGGLGADPASWMAGLNLGASAASAPAAALPGFDAQPPAAAPFGATPAAAPAVGLGPGFPGAASATPATAAAPALGAGLGHPLPGANVAPQAAPFGAPAAAAGAGAADFGALNNAGAAPGGFPATGLAGQPGQAGYVDPLNPSGLSAPGMAPAYGVPAGQLQGMPPAAAAAPTGPSAHDLELAEVERKQRESARKIQELKDQIQSFKTQNEAAAAEREARARTFAGGYSAAPAPAPAQPAAAPAAEYQAPAAAPARYTGNAADLKADMKRQAPYADDVVIADMAENVVQGHMTVSQAMQMLQEMGGAAHQEQERRDEAYARQLQAMEDNQHVQPPPSNTVQYDGGVGGISRVEQEQRDMALAQALQDQENRQTRRNDTRRPQHDSGHAHQGGGGDARIERISIPEHEIRDRTCFFRIVVTSGQQSYDVYRRYNQFSELHDLTQVALGSGPPFPAKALLSMVANPTEKQLKARAQALEQWLQDYVEKVKSSRYAMLRGRLDDFLEANRIQ